MVSFFLFFFSIGSGSAEDFNTVKLLNKKLHLTSAGAVFFRKLHDGRLKKRVRF